MGSRTVWRRIALTAIASCIGTSLFATCSEGHVDLKGDWGQARFRVEVADDQAERSQGLMHREEMSRSAGMLFVYDAPQRVQFWMKNTLIPLDLIFMDHMGQVTKIHKQAIPLDLTGIDGGDQVQFVLEINGGLVDLMGINVGTHLRHPAISDQAFWKCE